MSATKAKQANISSFFLPRAAPPSTPASTTPPPNCHPSNPSAASSLLSPKARAKPSPISSAIFSPPTPLPPTPPSSSSLSSALPLTPSSLSELAALTPPSPPSELQGRKRKTINYAEPSDDVDEDEPLSVPVTRKKGRRIEEDDEEEYLPGMDVEEEKDGGDEGMEVEEVKEEKAVKRPPVRRSPSTSSVHVQPRSLSFPSVSSSVVNAVLRADLTVDPNAATTKKASDVTSSKEWDDSFLRPENLRDAKGVKVGEPGYDPSTLSIPSHIWKSLTPAQQQYFDIKKNNFDLVLFYKIGKFYELYDRDAEIGVSQLGLTYMVHQARPHCGFPEAAYDKYSKMAVNLGHRIGRVEQTQTPRELKEANSTRQGKASKIVERALCSVLTPGTLTDVDLIGSHHSASLLALVERELTPPQIEELALAHTRTALGAEVVCEYGVAFVDCSTGQFTIGQFWDDNPRSQLATLLATVTPREVITLHLNLSENTHNIFRNELTPQCYAQLRVLKPEQFLSAEKTFEFLQEGPYFRLTRRQPGEDELPVEDQVEDWPPALIKLSEDRKELAFHALGGLIHMLVYTKNDHHLLSGKDFTLYTPSEGGVQARNLILDTQALTNLEIMRDSEGNQKGSLLTYLDRCVNPMGKRQIKRWLSSPLGELNAINDRLKAVEFLRDNPALRQECQSLLRSLPDLERLISTIHAYSIKKEKTEVMYGQQEQRKLTQFVQVMDGLERALDIPTRVFARYDVDSDLSVELSLCSVQFPHYDEVIQEFRGYAEDWAQAKVDGFVTPKPGMIPAYDEACEAETAAQEELQRYLEEQRDELRCKDIKFVNVNRDRFTLEIPTRIRLSHDYTVVTGTAKLKRYYTTELKERLIPALEDAELEKERIEKDATRLIYGKFVSFSVAWKRALQAIATLDCLCALAVVSAEQMADGLTCRPEFIPLSEDKAPLLELRQCVHPVLAKNMPAGKGRSFIPNDIALGCAECPASIVLLSGANMGGKSTLLRQACIAVILAQLGCFVPAQEARLTPVDRIFTRCGAADRLMAGQSTFFVEMSETAIILNNASRRSLVILDELGRGTATFDGMAIAFSVVEYIRLRLRCLTLFSTHYHQLLEQYKGREDQVDTYHMQCMEQSDSPRHSTNTTPRQRVDFLYLYKKGISPKSYGMNVALLAGLPRKVVDHATEISEEFERKCTLGQKGGSRTKVTQAVRGQLTRKEVRAALARIAEIQLLLNK